MPKTNANDNVRLTAHNARLASDAAQRRAQRRADGLARAAAHNHELKVAKHQRIYGGYQIPMFG
jgi:hypothetical protein